MRALCIHKNIPVSDSELTLSLQVSFISCHLTAEKHLGWELSKEFVGDVHFIHYY